MSQTCPVLVFPSFIFLLRNQDPNSDQYAFSFRWNVWRVTCAVRLIAFEEQSDMSRRWDFMSLITATALHFTIHGAVSRGIMRCKVIFRAVWGKNVWKHRKNVETWGASYIITSFSEILSVLHYFNWKHVPMIFFWVKSPCGLVGRKRRFWQPYCLQLHGDLTQNRTEHKPNPHLRENLKSHMKARVLHGVPY
jgi:hypothetical protein